MVEIGRSVDPAYQRRRYATAMLHEPTVGQARSVTRLRRNRASVWAPDPMPLSLS
jgi:hypothetical protein